MWRPLQLAPVLTDAACGPSAASSGTFFSFLDVIPLQEAPQPSMSQSGAAMMCLDTTGDERERTSHPLYFFFSGSLLLVRMLFV